MQGGNRKITLNIETHVVSNKEFCIVFLYGDGVKKGFH